MIHKPTYYGVFEKEPRKGSVENGLIFGPFSTIEEAEKAKKQFGFVDENFYVDEYQY